jgi:hypothetical protein
MEDPMSQFIPRALALAIILAPLPLSTTASRALDSFLQL